MKFDYQDFSVLSTLHPKDIEEYLSSRGWQNLEENPGKYTLWEYNDETGNCYDIILPISQKFMDYGLRISEIIKTLETVEKRQQPEILKDLQMIFADIIRVRRDTPETKGGNVPIDMGVKLVQESNEMMLAVACSTKENRPYFAKKNFKDAIDYLDTVFFGQTELGSYILPIISRLPASDVGQSKLNQFFDELPSEEPFERQVTQNLACALEVMNSTAQDIYERESICDSFDIFDSTVENCVSANLCEAVVEMSYYKDSYQDLEIDFT